MLMFLIVGFIVAGFVGYWLGEVLAFCLASWKERQRCMTKWSR
jgi:hypothetical protein